MKKKRKASEQARSFVEKLRRPQVVPSQLGSNDLGGARDSLVPLSLASVENENLRL